MEQIVSSANIIYAIKIIYIILKTASKHVLLFKRFKPTDKTKGPFQTIKIP